MEKIILTKKQVEIMNDHKGYTNQFEIDGNGNVYAVCSDGHVLIDRTDNHHSKEVSMDTEKFIAFHKVFQKAFDINHLPLKFQKKWSNADISFLKPYKYEKICLNKNKCNYEKKS